MKTYQRDRIASKLRRRWMSAMDMIRECGTTSPHRRMTDIRKRGWVIVERWAKVKSGPRFKQYRIVS